MEDTPQGVLSFDIKYIISAFILIILSKSAKLIKEVSTFVSLQGARCV